MDNQALKKFYDELYTKNPEVFGTSSLNFLERIFAHISAEGTYALDVGSGAGVTSEFLAKLGFHVDAVDISELARKNHLSNKITWHTSSIQNFDIRREYSFAYFALVVHHLEVNVFEEIVHKLKRHAPGGSTHAYRLFTTKSDFYREGTKTFFDDGSNLNSLYEDWKIIYDERHDSRASTTDAVNEVREVAYSSA